MVNLAKSWLFRNFNCGPLLQAVHIVSLLHVVHIVSVSVGSACHIYGHVKSGHTYGVATISRLHKFIGLFCKRAL